ncbi:hexitol phosphatase HxpB [Vulgatibacter sp.]|uniref:hexitol phosphatase HxpB n=1 Tax=Vulgatibacter sp. TaxID=1971226 RepID=UPI003562239B
MIRAAIFDMDGLLIDSEPLWRAAEVEVFRSVGVPLTEEMCHQTTGLRIDDVVAHWHRRHPWEEPGTAVVQERIVRRMIELIGERGSAKRGVDRALDWARGHGLAIALASSSPMRIIEAVLGRLGIADRFVVVRSAEEEPWGKPHPAIFLSTAAALGVRPEECLVFEDSLTGVIAAKAARMRCACVPEAWPRQDGRFVLAEACLPSLEAVSDELLR